MPIMYRSQDDGQFYREEEVDDPRAFWRWEVNETLTFTPDDLCGHNDLGELLSRTGQGRDLTPGHA